MRFWVKKWRKVALDKNDTQKQSITMRRAMLQCNEVEEKIKCPVETPWGGEAKIILRHGKQRNF